MKNELIDDMRLPKRRPKWGYPILFTNHEIRRMLTLANAGKNDIFYDLGCGWGQNLIIALTEFRVKKVVGIENDYKRSKVARRRLEKVAMLTRWRVIKDDFEKLFSDKLENAKLKEATIVFYGLDSSKTVLNGLQKRLKSGCKLINYFNCLFPEIKYDKIDYPFYISKFPFKKPRSQNEWLRTVVSKRKIHNKNEKKLDSSKLWEELQHDYDVIGLRDEVRKYKRRLRNY